MTFNELVLNYLEKNCMAKSQAQSVIKMMKESKASEDMERRWNDNVEDYPVVMQKVIIMTLRRTAVDWIDENLPQAWFRPLFAVERV